MSPALKFCARGKDCKREMGQGRDDKREKLGLGCGLNPIFFPPFPLTVLVLNGQLSETAGWSQFPCQAQLSSTGALCHPTLAGALATGVGCPSRLDSLLAALQMLHSCKGGQAGREKPVLPPLPGLPEATIYGAGL